nr:unnamed protein product [Callosobruchus analis]
MIIQFILGVTCITMFLVGSVGTFIEYQPDYYKGFWRYCDYNLYMFAFYCYFGEYLVLAIVILYLGQSKGDSLLANEALQNITHYVYRKPNPYPKDTRRLGTIVLIVCIIIPVVKIIIGITHRNYCDTNIILCGDFHREDSDEDDHSVHSGSDVCYNVLVGSVGTFIEYQPDYYKGSWRYCDYNLYMFAFYCYIGEYLVLAIVILYLGQSKGDSLLANKALQNITHYVSRKPNPYPKDTRRLGIIVLIVCIIIPVVKIIIGITH